MVLVCSLVAELGGASEAAVLARWEEVGPVESPDGGLA